MGNLNSKNDLSFVAMRSRPNCLDIMPKAQIARIWRLYSVSGFEIDHIAKREGVSRCHVHWAIAQGRRP